jgi:hypothetical protein
MHEESAAGLCQRLATKEYAHVVYTAHVLAPIMFTMFSVAQECCKVSVGSVAHLRGLCAAVYIRALQVKNGIWQLSQIYGHQTAQGSRLKC